MIWIFYVTVGLVALVLLMALVGLALPAGHVASRCAALAKPPDIVWRALVDLDDHVRWRRGVRRIERLDATTFREHGRNGAITYAIEADEPPRRRVTRIADDKLPFGGRWIYELAADPGGTRLTITEDGFVKNPIFRLLSKTVFSPTRTIEQFLVDLGAHLGVEANVLNVSATRPR